jgi:multiple sugar transport system substrate-binding protein
VARRREQRGAHAEQRAQAKKNYDELIATAGFPEQARRLEVRLPRRRQDGVIFESAKNKKRAKEFVTFMMQDENLQPYVEGLARPLVSR